MNLSESIENEALRAVDAILSYWDVSYFQNATQETGFAPVAPAYFNKSDTAAKKNEFAAPESVVTQSAKATPKDASALTAPSLEQESVDVEVADTDEAITREPEISEAVEAEAVEVEAAEADDAAVDVAEATDATDNVASGDSAEVVEDVEIADAVEAAEAAEVVEATTVPDTTEGVAETAEAAQVVEDAEAIIDDSKAQEAIETTLEVNPQDAVGENSEETTEIPATDNQDTTTQDNEPSNINVSDIEAEDPQAEEKHADTPPTKRSTTSEPPPPAKLKPNSIRQTPSNLVHKMGKGGAGWWKYETEHRGTDLAACRVQFLTKWSTPTPTSPIPRANAAVWFTYEQLSEERVKELTPLLINEIGSQTNEDVTHYATVTYRFEHNHLSHKLAIPRNYNQLQLVLLRESKAQNNSDGGQSFAAGFRLSAPFLRIPEIIASSLLISKAVESEMLLKKAPKKAKPADDAASETSASNPQRVNGNGISLEILQELVRTENYPVWTAKQVMMRGHLQPAQIAQIPAQDEELFAKLELKAREDDDARLLKIEARKQIRMTSRGVDAMQEQ
ncbi:hypothetical protein BJ741DRAFT_200089 [Chytriomyces cf. hyalinus JEL632]|nr:hypothetical protein BJ741DRAFT_200089 [Chytriomyces cf. hyalinus JEL632]